AGSHTVTVSYGGDANVTGSTSGALTQTVNAARGTLASLNTSVNPSVAGQTVTFTATVSPSVPGSGAPTGFVSFTAGATVLSTMTLDAAGKAAFATSSLAVGTHSITAAYGGDGTFNASTSPVLTQTVSRTAPTNTVVASDRN